jgi:hypothetical protein
MPGTFNPLPLKVGVGDDVRELRAGHSHTFLIP